QVIQKSRQEALDSRGSFRDGDTNRLWVFKQFRRAACFLGTQDTTDGLFQTIYKRSASKRMTGAAVLS
ncbi:hypothetical protein LCGC14_2616710, partial [marine sediment metagenome]